MIKWLAEAGCQSDILICWYGRLSFKQLTLLCVQLTMCDTANREHHSIWGLAPTSTGCIFAPALCYRNGSYPLSLHRALSAACTCPQHHDIVHKESLADLGVEEAGEPVGLGSTAVEPLCELVMPCQEPGEPVAECGGLPAFCEPVAGDARIVQRLQRVR